MRRDTKYLCVFGPNAGKCGKNADQNNSEYGHFLRSASFGLQLMDYIVSNQIYVFERLKIGSFPVVKSAIVLKSLQNLHLNDKYELKLL